MHSTRPGFVRRGLLVVIAVLTAAGWMAAPAAAGAAAPAEYRYVGTYLLASWCQTAGKNGVADGDWQTYTCAPERAGLDTWWELWVSP
jgi:hypothetical protein